MTSLLEYLDSDWEMTVLPQPKAPGMAVVPPCTHLYKEKRGKRESINLQKRKKVTKKKRMCDSREKGVQHSLSSQQRVVGRQLLCDGPHLSDRPHLHHGEFLLHPLKLQLHHHILTHTHTPSTQPNNHFWSLTVSKGLSDSLWCRSFQEEPRRSQCPGFWEAAWSCAWWGNSHTPYRRCLLLWCDCRPNRDKREEVDGKSDWQRIWTYGTKKKAWRLHRLIPAGSCWGKTPTWCLGWELQCLHLWECRYFLSGHWCPLGVAGYHQRWTPWFLDPTPQREVSPSAAQDLQQTHRLRSSSEKSTRVWTGEQDYVQLCLIAINIEEQW